MDIAFDRAVGHFRCAIWAAGRLTDSPGSAPFLLAQAATAVGSTAPVRAPAASAAPALPAPVEPAIGDPAASATYAAWLGAFPEISTTDGDIAAHAPAALRELIRGTGFSPDCADTALVLRHTFLAAHGESLMFRAGGETFTIGSGVAAAQLKRVLVNVGSIHFQETRKDYRLVEFYKKGTKRLVNLKALLDAGLGAGDVVVWKRPHDGDSFGHVQTVQKVDRAGAVLTLVQGNMTASGVGSGQLQQRQRTFAALTAAADGDADIATIGDLSFFGAGPWSA